MLLLVGMVCCHAVTASKLMKAWLLKVGGC
jgi:hypothetical protein